jgi:hypothetical protein
MASGRPGVGSRAQKGISQPLIAQRPAWKDWVGEYRLCPQFSLRIFEREGRLMTKVRAQIAIPAEVCR